MTAVQRIVREPAALLGLVTATTGLLILFGLDLSAEQAGGVLTFVGAVVALLRLLVTPSSEVVARREPVTGAVVAGPASWVVDGHAVTVEPTDTLLDES